MKTNGPIVKRLFITCVLLAVCESAFAGEISFTNDSLHLGYYDPNSANLKPADSALAGTCPSSGNMPSGVTLVADLFGGMSPSALSLISTTTFSATQGRFVTANIMTSLPGGSPAYFQVQVRDNNFATASDAYAAGSYSGLSDIFTCAPGTSTYNSIVNPFAPANSSWSNGSYVASACGGAGARGAIKVSIPPTPPPSITSQPTDQRVPGGTSATFMVTATGQTPLSYQWQYNGSPIAAATNSSYTVVSANIFNVGPYDVVITNTAGMITSAVATLTVAYTAVWTNTASGKWEAVNNWVGGFLPAATQSVYVTSFGSKTLTLDATTASGFSNTMTIFSLGLFNLPGSTNTLRLVTGNTNPPLHVLSSLFLQQNGSLVIDSNSILQADGQTTVSGYGPSGVGAFVLNSGSATLASTIVGNATNEYGALALNGGTLLMTNTLILGCQGASTGAVTMTSGKLIVTNGFLAVGSNGYGSFLQSGGTNQAALVAIASGAGSQGSYTLSNATLNATTLNLGSSAGGLGSLTIQSNAVVNVSSNISIVSGSLSSTSSITLSGGSLTATNGFIQVGPTGAGQFLITGGNHTIRQLRLGSTNGIGGGFFYMSGGSLKILGNGAGPAAGLDANYILVPGGDIDGTGTILTIGDGHSADAYWSGNAVAQFATMYVGYTPGFTGTYTQSNTSTMIVSSNLVVGDCAGGAVGMVTLSGGALYVTNAAHTALLDVRNGLFVLGSNATLVVDNLVVTNDCGLFMNNGGQLLPYNTPVLQLRMVPLLAGGNFSLGFQTLTNTNYVILQTTNLASPVFWVTNTSLIGIGNFVQVPVPISNGSPRFFRVRQQ